MRKRGQAAMEFLMTYGWAILAAVIVIGVLSAFGVFSPSKYVPNKCIMSAPLGCNAGTVDATGVHLEIRNGAGESIDIVSITVPDCGTYTGAPDTMADQDLQVFDIACTPTAGEKFQDDITVAYMKAGSTLELSATGEIVDTV